MYRVLLVDDEPYALEGLMLQIDWRGMGFEVIGQYTRPKEALQAILRDKPDLVVTDLYMPGLDGVGLMTAARGGGYEGLLVIASGYRDFDMAKEALHHGAIGYLLKPLDEEEAAHTLRLALDRLAAQRPEDDYARRLVALLTREQAAPQHDLGDGLWQILSVGQPLSPSEMQYLQHLMTGGTLAVPLLLYGTQYIALHAESAPALALAVGSVASAPPLEGRLLFQTDLPCPSSDLPAQYDALRGELDALVIKGQAALAALLEAISLLEEDVASRTVATLATLAQSHSIALERTLLERAWRGCYALFDPDPQEARTFLQQAGPEASISDTPIATGLTHLCTVTINILRQRENSLLTQMKRYAQAHYADSISLATMAHALGHNSAYLGRVFKQEAGQSFRQWLNTLRLREAAGRIRTEKKPIYQIAEAVGYTKYSYFLEKFKALYGIMPEQYRHLPLDGADIEARNEILLQEGINHQDRHG